MKKIMFSIGILFSLFLISSTFSWWDYSWGYRKKVTFTENSGYELNNGLVEYWFNHEGKAQNDCDDIRPINDLEVEIPYNISSCNSTHVFLTHVLNITGSGNKDYYVYYNNSGASSNSQIISYIKKDGDSDLFKEEIDDLRWDINCENDGSENYGIENSTVNESEHSYFTKSGVSHGTGCNDIYNDKYWGFTTETNTSLGLWSGFRKPIRIEWCWLSGGGTVRGDWLRFGNRSIESPPTFFMTAGYYYFNNKTGWVTYSSSKDIWQYFILDNIDWTNHKLDIYVDGISKGNSSSFNWDTDGIDYIQHYSGSQDGDNRYSFLDCGIAYFNISETIYPEENMPPTWRDIIENQPNPSVYNPSTNYGFQVNFTDDLEIDTVLFNHNLTGSYSNVTCSNITDIFYANISNMGGGILSYSFIGNDTSNNQNQTNYNIFTVTALLGDCNLTSSSGWSLPYDNSTTLTCICNSAGNLYFNHVLHNDYNASSIAFGGGIHNVTCNMTGTSNNTFAQDTNNLTISKISPDLNISLNGTYGNRYYNDSDVVNYTVYKNPNGEVYLSGNLTTFPVNETQDKYTLIWYHLNSESGSTAIDSGNESYDGILKNMNDDDWIEGKLNNALNFDGVNDYIDAGDIASFERDEEFSFEMWFKTSTTSVDVLMDRYGSSRGWSIYLNSGKITVALTNDASHFIKKETTSTYNNGVYHHLIVTYDGSSNAGGLIIYVDGETVPISTISNSLDDTIITSYNLSIASRQEALYYEGILDEIVIYPEELQQSYITQRYNSGLGTESIGGGNISGWFTPYSNNAVISCDYNNTIYSITVNSSETENTSYGEFTRYAICISGLPSGYYEREYCSSLISGYLVKEIQYEDDTIIKNSTFCEFGCSSYLGKARCNPEPFIKWVIFIVILILMAWFMKYIIMRNIFD